MDVTLSTSPARDPRFAGCVQDALRNMGRVALATTPGVCYCSASSVFGGRARSCDPWRRGHGGWTRCGLRGRLLT